MAEKVQTKNKNRRRGPYGRSNYDTELDYAEILSSCKPSFIQANDKIEDEDFEDISSSSSYHGGGLAVDPQQDENMSFEEHGQAFDMDQVTKHQFETEDLDLEEILQTHFQSNAPLEADYDIIDADDCDACLDPDAYTESNQGNYDQDFLPLFPGSSVTVGAFMLLLAIFTTRYNLIGDATQHLLNIIAFALPSEHNLCTTLYEFKKFFRNLRNPLVYHYYCSYCLGLIEDNSIRTCPYDFCGKTFNKKTGSYFLEMPLQNQIQNLFAQEQFYDSLQHRFQRQSLPNTYSDIYDGNLYKSHFDNDGILGDPNNISFTFNTDGAAVFKSSKVSVWPIFLVINELPYKQRMKKENMLLASLWFGCQKPAMATFLKPLQKSLIEMEKGIQCISPTHGSFVSKGILLCGTADLPARSMLCNHMQYNGAYSCWKCEQAGTSTPVGKGHAHVFPFNEDNAKGPERTLQNVIENARTAVENQNDGKTTNYSVKGVKGPSRLMFFPKFNMVSGIAIDYMHGVLLGVQKLLLELWVLQKYSKEPFSFHQSLLKMDERLLQIRPTLDITRLPRSIQDLQHWKASEYRAFLLFYGVAVLHGILDDERFSHYLLFVNAMHILLKCGSTDNDLVKAEVMLVNFCKHFATCYNECFMRLNVHQLLHLTDCVRDLGPLYTSSCFSFEDKNGVLLKMIRGTQNIDNQMVTGVSFIQKLPELKGKCIANGSPCENLYNSIESPILLKRTTTIGKGVYILGGIKEKTLTESETEALQNFLGCDPMTDKFKTFNRMEIGENIVYGLNYTRMVKRDNSTIEYINQQAKCFAQVHFFMSICLPGQDHEQVLAVIEKLQCLHYDESSNILAVSKTKKLQVIEVQHILSSCMLISYQGAKTLFLCKFPNRLESD